MNKVSQPKSAHKVCLNKMNFVFIVFGIIIILYGVFLRLYGLDIQSWWIDEAYSINAAVSTIEKGYPLLDSGWLYNGQLAFTYPLAAFVKVFGLHNWSTRLPSVIFNFVFLGVIFQFCRRFFNTRVAVLVTLFMTFSYWEIAWARQARNYAMFQLFFWISIYYFWEILFNKFSYKNLLAWITATLITLLTHGLALLLLPIYGVTFIIVFWKKIIKENIQLLKNKVAMVMLVTTLIVFLIFKGNIIAVISGNTMPEFYRINYIKFAIEHFKTTMLIGLIPLVAFYKQNLNKKTASLIIYYLSFLIATTFFINLPGHRYMFVILPVLYILSALGIDFILNGKWWEKIDMKYKNFISILSLTILTFLLIISGEFKFTPSESYFLESDPSPAELIADGKEPYKYYIYAPQPDWEAAYQYIEQNRKPDDIIISAQPVFSSLYTGESEYWIPYSLDWKASPPSENEYVNAKNVNSVSDVKALIKNKHGYIILDFLSLDARIDSKYIEIINSSTKLAKTISYNNWSEIKIFEF